MSAVIRVDDDDITILSEVPKQGKMNKIFIFPYGKTLRVDLDEGKIESLKSYELPKKTLLNSIFNKKDPMSITSDEKIYINGQLVEDYPAIYITLHKSLEELKKSITKIEDEKIMEEFMEIRDKFNKKIQSGGSLCKTGGYKYRKKGGLSFPKLMSITKKIGETINPLNLLIKNKNKKDEQIGGAELVKDLKQKIKDIYNLSNKTINKGFSQINQLSKNALLLLKGGKYMDAKKEIKKMEKCSKSMKMSYKKRKYCGGYQCNPNCPYCIRNRIIM